MKALPRRTAVIVFGVFAFAYFLSALIRAITATLSPVLTQEFALHARDLGLLAGGYFLGFSLTQLPLGAWLDQYGPKRVLACFLAVAILGCLAFSMATTFVGLFASRVLSGVGVSACLMAPLTGYRRWYAPDLQMRSNSWMLMAGSLGMVASTLPVQWLAPIIGWRPLFLALAAMLLLAMTLIVWRVPRWEKPQLVALSSGTRADYSDVWRHPYFRAMAPIGFFCYGGLVAVQTLWAAPWMVRIAKFSPLQAAQSLFWLNVAMLCTFWTWGLAGPWLTRRRIHADRLLIWGMPVSFLLLALLIVMPDRHYPWSGMLLALYCMACTFITPSLPSIGLAFGPEAAGRALSAYNLVVFVGVFAIQWGIGLLVDGLTAIGMSEALSFKLAFGTFLACCVASYVYFLNWSSHNRSP